MRKISQRLPSPFDQVAGLLFWPSVYEEEPAFRSTLIQVLYAGFRWGGVAGALGLTVYVSAEVLVLGRPIAWIHRPGYAGEEVALLSDLLLVSLCGGAALLPRIGLTLGQGRAFAAGATLAGAGAFLRSDIIQGVVEVEFVALLYLLVVAAVPFRPWQALGIGGGIGAVFSLLGAAGWFVPAEAAEAVQVGRHALGLGFSVLLGGLVSGVLYATRRAQHRERQEAQQALREERDRFETLFEASNDAIVILDPENDEFLAANPQAVDLFGYDRRELLNEIGPSDLHEQDLDRFRAFVEETFNEGKGWTDELTCGRKEGGPVPTEISASVIEFEGQSYLLASIREISQRKEREWELEKTNATLEAILESLPPGILAEDATGEVVAANRGLCEVLGAPASSDELEGRECAEVAEEAAELFADPEKFIARIEEILENGEPTRGEELRLADGRVLERDFVPYELPGDGEAALWLYRDVTEQKEREQALRDRKEKIKALYAATDRLLQAEDEEEVGALLIELIDETLGYPAAAVRFARSDQLVPSQVSSMLQAHMPERPSYDIQGDTLVAEVYRTGETRICEDVRSVEDSVDRGDLRAAACVSIGPYGTISVGSPKVGEIRSFDLRLIEILAAHVAAVLGRLEHERELIEAKEEAKRMNRLKSAFLANMSHEIRTPLTSIIGFAEAIGEEVEALEERLGTASLGALGRFADLIERSGNRLLETLNAVLTLSKLEAGEMELSLGSVDLAAEAEETAGELRSKAEEAGVNLEVEADEVPSRAQVDEGGLQVALRNLVSNAIKYTEEGGQVWVRAREEHGAAVLEVEDTGIGMDPGRVSELFEAFKQESEGTSREYEGTGLGLAVTKRVVEQMDGSIEIETEKGKGSRFIVRLPRAEEAR